MIKHLVDWNNPTANYCIIIITIVIVIIAVLEIKPWALCVLNRRSFTQLHLAYFIDQTYHYFTALPYQCLLSPYIIEWFLTLHLWKLI